MSLSWSERLTGGFKKTSERLSGNLAGLGGTTKLTPAQLDEIEDALIVSDLGPRAASLWGIAIAAVGTVVLGLGQTIHTIALGYSIASLGFGPDEWFC